MCAYRDGTTGNKTQGDGRKHKRKLHRDGTGDLSLDDNRKGNKGKHHKEAT